jgi:acetyl-CoA carboxylase biotin carboxyl carrier protein
MAKEQSKTGDVFDLNRIRSLIELMKEHDLSEVDLRQAEQQIRLARGTTVVAPTVVAAPAPAPASAPSAPAHAAPAADDKHVTIIKSPMVGTFYSRANPKSPPFVKVGDLVTPEKTICIIEAMKVFNEIPAEVRGKIVAVLVNEEEAVEFGKPLFKVDTSV